MILLDHFPSSVEAESLPPALRFELSFYKDLGRLLGNGWSLFWESHEHKLNWEDGAKLARKLGYKHLEPTSPGILPPIMWRAGKRITFYGNAVEVLLSASFDTRQQPQGWTGEIQIKDPSDVWLEERFGVIYNPSHQPTP